MSLNKVSLIGSVGKDPEIRKTQDGKLIASFSLATSESWKNKQTGAKEFKTEWHKIVIFGELANIVEKYVKKGSKLYIEGSLKTREWADKEGVKRFTTEIVLQGFGSILQMLDSKPKSSAQESLDKSFEQAEQNFDAYENNDAPFQSMRFRKKLKYKNIKINGYDSKKENKRALELKDIQAQGLIKNLQEQVKFQLVDSFRDSFGQTERGIFYKADFVYLCLETNRLVCEDVKSEMTAKLPSYIIKRKLFKIKYPEYYFFENYKKTK